MEKCHSDATIPASTKPETQTTNLNFLKQPSGNFINTNQHLTISCWGEGEEMPRNTEKIPRTKWHIFSSLTIFTQPDKLADQTVGYAGAPWNRAAATHKTHECRSQTPLGSLRGHQPPISSCDSGSWYLAAEEEGNSPLPLRGRAQSYTKHLEKRPH